MTGPGSHRRRSPGTTRERLLETLKRRGPATLGALAGVHRLARPTLRVHLAALEADGLVSRVPVRIKGRGRPRHRYALTPAGHARFPQREGELLGDFACWLAARGGEGEIRRFLEERVEAARPGARARLRGLRGSARLGEVARILSEQGFMAELEANRGKSPVLRLCHCPIRHLVGATRVPCRVELGFVEEMVGRSLERISYIPAGDGACAYRLGPGRRLR
jgi:predicted ArsR family transcriptional regulator